MGNCQATEVSTVVIQHPCGRVERLYWPKTAEEVMRSNPGHHVALVTLCVAEERHRAGDGDGDGTVRFTRVRLLKPKDVLFLGQAYRLITSQEVTKALRARKQEKMKRAHSELIKKQQQQQQLQGTRDDMGGGELLKEGKHDELDGSRIDRDGVNIIAFKVTGFHPNCYKSRARMLLFRLSALVFYTVALFQGASQEGYRQRGSTSSAVRTRHWRPSLQSISEAGS